MRRGGDNVLVVGSGAAGLAAALAAADAGAEVTVLEHADHVGGTTAISGGVAWIPANHLAGAAGLGDTADDALRYLRAIGQGDYDDALVQVFVHEAADVACSIEERTRLRWSLLPDWPDYHPELPGGRAGGRSIWPEPLELAASVGRLVQTSPESPDVLVAPGSDGRITDAVVFRGPVRGRVLVGAMLEAVLERGVTVEIGVPVDGQLVEDGAVRGVRAAGADRLGRVVLATGGFQHDTDLARTFLPGPPEALAPMGTPGCTGDALRWTAGLGVALGNMSEAWWMPAVCVPGETLNGAAFYRPLHHERAQPGALMVDREGRRFVDEAQNYGDVGRSMLRFDAGSLSYPAAPCWLVFDAAYRRRTTVGPIGTDDPDPAWMRTADDLGALGDADAPRGTRRRWTYAELFDLAERTARALAARFEPGERIAVWSPTRPESLVLTYATALAGLVLVPVNPSLRATEARHILSSSGAAGVFLQHEYRGCDLVAELQRARSGLPALREHVLLDDWDAFLAADGSAGTVAPLPEVSGDDIAQIVYTSGTTGAPKGARLTHRSLTNAARVGAERFGIREGDVYVDPLPLFYVGGQTVALEVAQLRATYVMLGAFEPGALLDLLETERATLTVAVPTVLLALLEHPSLPGRDLRSLRSVSSGGSVVPAQLVRRVGSEIGASVTIVFGMTECSGFVSQTLLDDTPEDIAETIGPPLPGVETRVVDPNTGDNVREGDVGELLVRGFNVMSGYHEQPEATADAFAPDGWLRTGDLVTADGRGYLRIVGRLKDVVVTGAENVYPAEVEAVLHEDPGVGDVAVIGLPDERWGECVTAVIRPAPGADVDPATLERFVRGRLAPYKVPRRWIVVDDLPLTASGKVQKHVLRRQLEVANEGPA